MVTKTVVTTLLTLFFSFSYGMRELFPEILRNCPINECVQSNCPHFKRRLEEYKQTRNNDALNELKDLICNEGEKARCCKKQEKITARTMTPRLSLEQNVKMIILCPVTMIILFPVTASTTPGSWSSWQSGEDLWFLSVHFKQILSNIHSTSDWRHHLISNHLLNFNLK